MQRLLRLSSSLAILLMSLTSAFAETVTVPANRTSVVGGFTVGGGLSNGCNSTRLKSVVSRAPEHGKVTTKWLSFVMDKGGCKGHRAQGLAILYTPHKGYHGPDSLRVNFIPLNNNGWTGGNGSVMVDILVK